MNVPKYPFFREWIHDEPHLFVEEKELQPLFPSFDPVNPQPSKLYLLSGNGSIRAWWADALPHFRNLEAIPLELPGYGDNPSEQFGSLEQLADALLEMTEPGHPIFAVGINALVVLHALVKKPGHFSKAYLLAPVGAFLE